MFLTRLELGFAEASIINKRTTVIILGVPRQAIIGGDAKLLRRATEEALFYLQWLTRFSEAKFKPDEEPPR